MGLKASATAVAATLAAMAASACGGGEHPTRSPSPAGAAGLEITPLGGGPHTSFTFTFTAPETAGRRGNTNLGYTLAVSGPRHAGCLAARAATVSSASKGSRVSINLDPSKLGSRWCQGGYVARVTEIQTPFCAAGTVCPHYVRVVGAVARATFRVTRH